MQVESVKISEKNYNTLLRGENNKLKGIKKTIKIDIAFTFLKCSI